MNPNEEYEKITGKKWWINPICHGEYGFCSDEYMLWLESELKDERKNNKKLLEILRLAYIHYHGHSDKVKEIYEAITGREIDK